LDDSYWHPEVSSSVVYSGGLSERKGVCELVRVWPRIRQEVPGVRLLLFGRDGRMHTGELVSQWIRSFLGDADRLGVEFRGHVPRDVLATAYRQASLVVLPSHYEAFGMAAAEAMWCGCPLVFTQYGSGQELLRDGVEGLLVNPHQPDSIAEALLRILNDSEFAAQLGRAAASRARREFALERVLARNLEFYEDCRLRFAAGGRR
jgi:glycosyltransferase involved in cell wall biosynthesis